LTYWSLLSHKSLLFNITNERKTIMKLLYKLSTKRTCVKVLNTILVTDGTAWASDTDCYISHPCGKPDGLYDAHKAKIGIWQLVDELSPEDFPVIPNELTDMDFSGNDLPIESLKWVSQAMSEDPSRFYLNGVYFDTEYLAATNGDILKRIEQYGPVKPFIMPDTMVGAIVTSGATNYSLCFNGKHIFVRAGNYKIIAKAIEGNYPDYARVIPTDRDTGIPFDTSPFKSVLKRVKELDKLKLSKNRLVKLSVDGMAEYAGNKDIPEPFGKLVTSSLPFDIGFNCEYLAKGDISGLAYLGQNARNSVAIYDGSKTFVIMPVRL